MSRHARQHHNQQSYIFPDKKKEESHEPVEPVQASEPEQALDDGRNRASEQGGEGSDPETFLATDADKEKEDGIEEREQSDQTPITPFECGYRAIADVPKVGIQVILSHTGTDEGARAFYKRSRFFKDGRWQMTGKWIDSMTGKDIDFEPKYWKEATWA